MDLNSKKTAVILVNYNGLTDSIECIKSLYKMDDIDDITIIFVDNASVNDEAKKIREIFPDIVVFRNNINRGFAAGNNIGIDYALKNNYGYIMILNNDTIVAPDITTQLKSNCTNDSISVPMMLYFNHPTMIWYGGGIINKITGNAKHKNMGEIDVGDTVVQKYSFATGCCIMMESSILKKVGKFDESYFMYCEDTEFCIRLAINRVSIKYVPTAKLWHKVSSSTGGSDSPFSTYYMTRNRLNYVRKYQNIFSCTAYPFSLLSRFIRMVTCKDEKVKKAFRRGIKDHLKGVHGKVDLN